MAKYVNGINVYQGMAEVRKIQKAGYSVKMLVCMIYEAFEKYQRNENLTQTERFVLGLRYSEFFAEGSNPEDYYVAEVKRQEFCRVLGYKIEDIDSLCKQICNLG